MLPSHWKKNGRVESKRRAATKRGPTAASKDSAKSAKAQMANPSADASKAANIMTTLIISLKMISSQLLGMLKRFSPSSAVCAATISSMLAIARTAPLKMTSKKNSEERRVGKEWERK